MKVSEHTISALARVITGDGDFTPYRSGPQLVAFFNQFGSEDTYGGGFPSRWYYAEEKLREFNDTPAMKDIIISTVDPRHFLGTEFEAQNAIDHVNQFLEYDDFQVILDGRKWKLCKIDESQIEIKLPYSEPTQITQVFISEQIGVIRLFNGYILYVVVSARFDYVSCPFAFKYNSMAKSDIKAKPFG